jgi:hypothetical protein
VLTSRRLDTLASLLVNDAGLVRQQLLAQKDAQWSMLRLLIRRFVQVRTVRTLSTCV